MSMKQIHEGGVTVIKPDRFFRDARGYFVEAFRMDSEFRKLTGGYFVQSNISQSRPFTLRGLHYQMGEPKQGKLIRCIAGKIYQVSVDVRMGSTSFGTHAWTILDDIHCESVWVPPGFANGFFAFDTGAIVQYEMTAPFIPEKERSLNWSDQRVGIKWPMGVGGQVIMSPKDRNAPGLSEIESWR